MFLESDENTRLCLPFGPTSLPQVTTQHVDLPDARTQGLVVAVGQQDIAWSTAVNRESISLMCSMEDRTSGVSGTAGQEAGRVQDQQDLAHL